MQISLKKIGNSKGFTLPAQVLEKLGWTEETQVELEIENGSVVLFKSAPTLVEMLSTVPSGYRDEEDNWGLAVGKETEI